MKVLKSKIKLLTSKSKLLMPQLEIVKIKSKTVEVKKEYSNIYNLYLQLPALSILLQPQVLNTFNGSECHLRMLINGGTKYGKLSR